VFAASLFHAMCNLSWMLFPSYGSHYDPRIVAPIIAGAAAIVAFIWGPRTLNTTGLGKVIAAKLS
jgi:hypothetical protein